MKRLSLLFLGLVLAILVSCAVKLPASNEYQINVFSDRHYHSRPLFKTLFISVPEASQGLQTEQMLYVNKPFEIHAFAKNVWFSPPAQMLHPLLVQSLQRSGYFEAVSSSPNIAQADYRLDTHLLILDQNFLHKPSLLEFSAKVVLTRVSDNKVLVSQIITQFIPCPTDTPYGGVLAANIASRNFTAKVVDFVSWYLDHRNGANQ